MEKATIMFSFDFYTVEISILNNNPFAVVCFNGLAISDYFIYRTK